MKQINSATKSQSHKDAQSKEIQHVKFSDYDSYRGLRQKNIISIGA